MVSLFPCFSSHFRVNTVRSANDEQQEPCRKEEHSRSKEFFLPTKRAVSFWATQFPTLTLAKKALYCFQRSLSRHNCRESALLFSAVTFSTTNFKRMWILNQTWHSCSLWCWHEKYWKKCGRICGAGKKNIERNAAEFFVLRNSSHLILKIFMRVSVETKSKYPRI